MRAIFVISVWLVFASSACSSNADDSEGNSGGSAGTSGGNPSSASGGSSNGGGASGAAQRAQIRFLYQTDWKDHLGTCAWISDYRIKFGATPVPVTAGIDVSAGALSAYVEVDGRTYTDDDVLHIFTCSKSQTSKQTLQLFGMFGTDLPLLPAHKYTLTLAGSAASIAEDP